MSKYAPPNDLGQKPWTVTRIEWARETTSVVYEDTKALAEWRIKGRQRHVSAKARRSTVEDLALFRVERI